jgi:hypothetical protein
MEILELSAKTGAGLDAGIRWLENRLAPGHATPDAPIH